MPVGIPFYHRQRKGIHSNLVGRTEEKVWKQQLSLYIYIYLFMQKKMRMELAYKPKKCVESSCAKDINANLGGTTGCAH